MCRDGHSYGTYSGFGAALNRIEDWTSLTFTEDWDMNTYEDNLPEVIPRLKGLKMDYCDVFLKSHLLPALRRLSADELPLGVMPVIPQLTDLSLSFGLFGTEGVHDLILTLAEARQLHQLGLSLFPNDWHVDNFTGVDWARYMSESTTCLPELGSLALQFRLANAANCTQRRGQFQAVGAVTCRFMMPKLQALKVVVVDVNDYKTQIFSWEDMFPPICGYRDLRRLAFSALDSVSTRTPNAMVTARLYPGFLRNFPHAGSLLLTTTNLPADDQDLAVVAIARLREITFDKCDMDEHALERFLLSISGQEVVNIARITFISNSTNDEPGHPRPWMDSLRRALRENFCVEFS